jgi:hypothetical protein
MSFKDSHADKAGLISESEDVSIVPFLLISGLALVLSVAVVSMSVILR